PKGGRGGRRSGVRFPVGRGTVPIGSRVAWDPPAYRAGQTVRVLYPPGQPEWGRVSSFWEHMPAILAGIIAVVFGLVSVGTAGDEPAASQAVRPRATPLARRAGCLLYVAAFSLGGLGLAGAGLAPPLALGGAGGGGLGFFFPGAVLSAFFVVPP